MSRKAGAASANKVEVEKPTKADRSITSSSTAEYFAKNLQQVGFSSPTKAVLTTLKEAFDNSLDACEENGILPDIRVVIERNGAGSLKNTERILVRVEDNGPGIPYTDVAKVFGEYLASSKFGRGRCTRGQQGIGISAATTWAMQTAAQGARVVTKVDKQRRAISCLVEIDLKNNKGVLRNKEEIDWDRPHGTLVEFAFDGRIQINGEAGLLAFLKANVLVNPHLRLSYRLPDQEEVVIERVSDVVPEIPDATEPHPHTMKLGEFLAHARIYGRAQTRTWLKTGFSRLSDQVIQSLIKEFKVPAALFDKVLTSLTDQELNSLYQAIQNADLKAPATSSVLAIGEESLEQSMLRLGLVDFHAVVSRKPTICDFKPVQIEVAIARLQQRAEDAEESVQVLRFANRVPLQFDKAGCAIVKAISTVNWKSYGLRQPRGSLPQGPYIIAVSVVSPFIKFKNASKETIDGSEELLEELRRALIQAGQKLARHLNRESREADLESKIQHIEKFAPILVECLVRVAGANQARKKAAEDGLMRLLGREARQAEQELVSAEARLEEHKEKEAKRRKVQPEAERPGEDEISDERAWNNDETDEELTEKASSKLAKTKKKAGSVTKKQQPSTALATRKKDSSKKKLEDQAKPSKKAASSKAKANAAKAVAKKPTKPSKAVSNKKTKSGANKKSRR